MEALEGIGREHLRCAGHEAYSSAAARHADATHGNGIRITKNITITRELQGPHLASRLPDSGRVKARPPRAAFPVTNSLYPYRGSPPGRSCQMLLLAGYPARLVAQNRHGGSRAAGARAGRSFEFAG